MTNELTHHGIKGQKWGRRRFQNSDGSLTNAGKKRYSKREAKEKHKFEGTKNDVKKTGLAVAGVAASATVAGIIHKFAKKNISDVAKDSRETLSPDEKKKLVQDMNTENAYRKAVVNSSKTKFAKDMVDETQKVVQNAKQMSDESIKNGTKKVKLDLSKMSDKEMREKINRELLERQYNSLFAPEISTVSKGQKVLNDTLSVAGGILSAGSSALAIALSIKQLKGG